MSNIDLHGPSDGASFAEVSTDEVNRQVNNALAFKIETSALSNAAPLPASPIALPGTSMNVARADHVHPGMGGSADGFFLPLSGGTMVGPLYYTTTGAPTSRSAQDRADDWTNVKDYGAVLNGTTVDTVALRAALVATPARGIIKVPAGGWNSTSFTEGHADRPILWQLTGNTFTTGSTPVNGIGNGLVESFFPNTTKYFGRTSSRSTYAGTDQVSGLGPAVRIDMTLDHTDGVVGGIEALQVNAATSATSAPNAYPFALTATLTMRSPQASGPPGTCFSAIAQRMAGAGPAMPFAMNPQVTDFTGLPSGTGGSMVTAEFNLKANKLDDGTLADGRTQNASAAIPGANRSMLDLKYLRTDRNDNTPMECGTGLNIGLSTELDLPYCSMKSSIMVRHNITWAALNLHHAIFQGNANAILMPKDARVAWSPDDPAAGVVPTNFRYLQYTTTGTARLRYMVGATEQWSISDAGASPRIVISGTPNLTPSLAITQAQTFSGTPSGPAINAHASFFGSVSFGQQANWYSFATDIDRVNAPGGASAVMIGAAFGGGATSTLTGGRNGLFINLQMSGDTPSATGSGAFYVAEGAFVRADYWNGGSIGDERGSLFGSNPSARAKHAGTIGSYGYRGAIGAEFDVGIDHPMLAKHGVDVVEWTDSKAGGWLIDHGYGIALQHDGTAPGFDLLYSVGSPFGWWPARATSTILGNYASVAIPGGPIAQVAVGIDFTGIQINRFGYRQEGAAIDGAGNVGGLTSYGETLQTRGVVRARTAVVNTITVVKGGEFGTLPALTVSAPPVSGTAATAVVATMGLRRAQSIVGNRGSGYATGNVLTLSGGTFSVAAQVTVAAVDSAGAIIDFTYTTPGSYTVLPANPITLTGGAGTGAKITAAGWQIATVAVSGGGTNYPEFPPPQIVPSGGVTTVAAMFAVTVTAVPAPLVLNPGGGLSIEVPANFANDAAAAGGGIAVGGVYRTGSALMVRAA